MIRLGRLFDIDIYLHFSWFFLLIWVFCGGREDFFIEKIPMPVWEKDAVACLTLVLVFLCVLIHEYAHYFLVRKHGHKTNGIVIFILGAMVRVDDSFFGPGDEFTVSIIGPISSLTLALVLYAVSYWAARVLPRLGVFPGLFATDLILEVLDYLIIINIILALFNFLPSFPMDGGRALLAIIWKCCGNKLRAAKIAMIVSLICLVTLLIIGYHYTGVWSWWLCAITAFLIICGLTEIKNVKMEETFKKIRVGEIMEQCSGNYFRELPTCLHDMSLWEAGVDREKFRVDMYVVDNNQKVIGLLSGTTVALWRKAEVVIARRTQTV